MDRIKGSVKPIQYFPFPVGLGRVQEAAREPRLQGSHAAADTALTELGGSATMACSSPTMRRKSNEAVVGFRSRLSLFKGFKIPW